MTITELLFKYFVGDVPCEELDKASFIIGFDRLLKLGKPFAALLSLHFTVCHSLKKKWAIMLMGMLGNALSRGCIVKTHQLYT